MSEPLLVFTTAAVKTVEELRISPPPGSVPATSLPLTFFDLQWFMSPPIQQVLFYRLPKPHQSSNSDYFRRTIIPQLTASLSLALRYFYPYAGRLFVPAPPEKPYIRYSEGGRDNSVPLTVAQTTALDFDQLTSYDRPNDVGSLRLLLPKLPPPEDGGDGKAARTLLAVKVTLFPDSASLCIGLEYSHVAADGMGSHHFLKSWASICRGDFNWVAPSHGRALIKDDKNLERIFLQHIWNSNSDSNSDSDSDSEKVRATFVIGREDISRLKEMFPAASTFAVAGAFVWTNFIRSLEVDGDGAEDGKIDSFLFLAECRGRLQPRLPATYFGNCLVAIHLDLDRRVLLGDGGFRAAVEGITARVKELETREGGVLEGLEKWYSGFGELLGRGQMVSVAGSPLFRVYDTDFGWGRPKKAEWVHAYASVGNIYFSDVGGDREEEVKGGIEFGLALSKAQMDAFARVFQQQLARLSVGG